MRILVTGGCGFIGSNFIQYLLEDPEIGEDVFIVNLDKQTYAGNGKNIENMGLYNHQNYSFVHGDICDLTLIEEIFQREKPDIVFNFAAESHVDRSIENGADFEKSNVGGVVNILESARKYGINKFIQISTDEVYGSIDRGSFSEESPLNPSSPYAASKAAAELIAISYYRTHNVPLIITRSANNYGPYQFPEKLLSLFITNLIDGKKVPLMWSKENPALNIRDWLHVQDNCRAIWYVSQYGSNGGVYNIPGNNEQTNWMMTQMLLKIFNLREDMIQKIPHRKGHDFRYSIKGDKLLKLGFAYKHTDIQKELLLLVNWYKRNEPWWRPLKND